MQIHFTKKFNLTISFKLTIIVIILGILPINTAAKQLPDLGNGNRTTLSIQEEKLIGEIWLQKLRASNLVCEEPMINSYLNHLGNKLAMHADIKHFNLKFFAIEDHSINAFAFFGGNIGIHKGLILATQDEQELAGAIAHEIGHISQEHLLRSIIKHKSSLPITLAAALASSLLGIPDLIIPILATQQQQIINFTREHEQEADNIGMRLLADAGFEPQGMIALFKRMSQLEQYDQSPPEYLRTHPIFENRISEAQSRANRFQYQQHSNSFNYYLIKANIESSATSNKQQIIATFKERLAKKRYNNQDATLYGYALVLTANYKYNQAYRILNELANKHTNNLIIQLALIDLLIAKKDLPQATTKMEHLLTICPNDTVLLLKYAEHLIAIKEAGKAKKILLPLTKSKPFEPITYRLLAQAESITGNNIGMHQATAEWLVTYGNIKEALLQLNIALDLIKNDGTLQTSIKRRKEELEKIMKTKSPI